MVFIYRYIFLIGTYISLVNWIGKQNCYNFDKFDCISTLQINAREYRSGNQKMIIQRNWQHRVHKTKKIKQKHSTICVGHHHTQTNTNDVSKTCALIQTAGDKNQLNIVCMRTSQQTHNRTTQKTKKMSNTDPTIKTGDELRCSRREGSSCFLQDKKDLKVPKQKRYNLC